MKQKKTVDETSLKIAKPSIRKVGTMLGSGALCIFAIGAVSIFGLASANENTSKETKAAIVTTTATENERAEETFTSLDTVTWRKASINEYEINQVVTSQTKATTVLTETTTKKTTSSGEEIIEKKLEKVNMYATEIVNLRVQPDKTSEALAVVNVDEKVSVTAYTNNGWYAVSYDGKEGYILKEYLTKNAPESETSKETSKTTTKQTQKQTASQTSTQTQQETTAETEQEIATQQVSTQTQGAGNYVVSCSDEEFKMLCCVLQGEVGNCSDSSKIAVANVIINRVKSSKFANTIEGVLTAPNQFTAVSGYYNGTATPSQNTIDCAKRALSGEDNTNGAVYYYAPRYCSSSSASWFESLTFCMEIDGQRYFK